MLKLIFRRDAIIFHRYANRVPKDELERVVSHIKAYSKEEVSEFLSVSVINLLFKI